MLSRLGDYAPDKLRETGVYAIVNNQNGKIYIGSAAVSFKNRWKLHLSKLKLGTHHSPYLQAAFAKYGEGSFSFLILKIVPKDLCLPVEQMFLDSLKSFERDRGYNILTVAGNKRGFQNSSQTRAKISASLNARTPEQKAKAGATTSLIHTGAKRTDEAKLRMSESHRGKVFSPEHRAKISQSMKGKPKSDKFIASLVGRNTGRVVTAETRQKISESLKAKLK
jgi:hypothetical protein